MGGVSTVADRADLVGDGTQGGDIEVPESGRVPAQHQARLVRRHVGRSERLVQVGRGPRTHAPGALEVRVVGPNGDLVDADLVARLGFGEREQRRADVALTPEVLGRLTADDVAHVAAQVAALVGVVHPLEGPHHPAGTLLGDDHLQRGVPLEHTAPDHVGEHLLGEEEDLGVVERSHRSRMRGPHQHPGRDPARDRRDRHVGVDRHLQVGELAPDRVEVGVEQRAIVVEGGQDHAAEPPVLGPADLRDARLDVLEADERHPDEAARRRLAEVGEPVVVRPVRHLHLLRRALEAVDRRHRRGVQLERSVLSGNSTSEVTPSRASSASRCCGSPTPAIRPASITCSSQYSTTSGSIWLRNDLVCSAWYTRQKASNSSRQPAGRYGR